MQTSPDIHDVIIIGAGPCGLAVAARIHEETPSAMFTDEEHQRYHWIKRHTGRMRLVQAGRSKNNGVRAEKWIRGVNTTEPERERRESTDSASSVPSLSSSSSSSSSSSPSAASLSTLVLDGSGEQWMQRWHSAFRVLEIQQLRSPMFFHVDPGDRDGMLAYTQEMGREEDLWEISGCVGKEMSKHKKKKRRQGGQSQTIGVEIDERDRKDYFSPSTGLFADYCSSIIQRYGLDEPGLIQKQEVTDIIYDYLPEDTGAPVSDSKIFTLTTSTGRKFHSRTVVLAIGAGGAGLAKTFPWPQAEGASACCHSMEIKSFPSTNVRDKIQRRRETNVVVVGGGLSSAQIVDMAVRKGVTKVWLIMRSEMKVKHFDISLPWMGKYKNWEKAAFWSADTDEERLEMMKIARNGGSIAPRYVKILKQHAARSRASIHPRTVITTHKYHPDTQTWTLTTDPPIPDLPPIDYIYFATGARTNVREMPFLSNMKSQYPIEIKEGLPCLSDDLMWREDVPLFMTGRMAGLRLGPGAPNLEGARLGAERIAWSLEEILGKRKEVGDKGAVEGFCGLGNRYASLVGDDDVEEEGEEEGVRAWCG